MAMEDVQLKNTNQMRMQTKHPRKPTQSIDRQFACCPFACTTDKCNCMQLFTPYREISTEKLRQTKIKDKKKKTMRNDM